MSEIKIGLVLTVVAAIGACGCSGSGESADESKTEKENKIEKLEAVRPAEITVCKAEVKDFNHEIISNGTLKARDVADLYFRSPEIIESINVKNGQYVAKGATIARIDVNRLKNTRRQQITSLEQARLSMKDILIGQGYDPDDTLHIPADVMRLARTKSGIENARAALDATGLDLASATLVAPFSGRIANLKQKLHNVAQTSEPFCRVIDDRNMEVEFPVMEGEIALVAPGQKVMISSFSTNESVSGTVTAVNPMVDDNGMVKVWASADKNAPGLIDGMNVRVHLRKVVPAQIVVPKTAVVKRNDRQVVFTYDGNGRARWNYVTTGLENMHDYTIVEGLEPGETVITGGNINLAHESPVTVVDSIR